MAKAASSSSSASSSTSSTSLWSTLLSETSKKPKIFDSSIVVLGESNDLRQRTLDVLCNRGEDRSSTFSSEFVDVYNFMEIEEGYSDTELGKVNMWSVEDRFLDEAFDVVAVPYDHDKRTYVIVIDSQVGISEAVAHVKRCLYKLMELVGKSSTPQDLKACQNWLVDSVSWCSSQLESQSVTTLHKTTTKEALKWNTGSPVLILVCSDALMASKDLQLALRWICVHCGGAYMNVNIGDTLHTELLRRYMLHRLYPENVIMSFAAESCGSNFCPAGYDSSDALLAISGGFSFDAMMADDGSVKLSSFSQRIDTSDASTSELTKIELESEEDWLQGLHQFVKQASETTGASLAPMAAPSVVPVAPLAEKPARRSSDVVSNAATKPRRVSVVAAQGEQDVNSFFQNLLEQKK